MSAAAHLATEDWLDALREACRETSQARVARRIGYSATVISQVLSGSYKGDLRAVRRAVEGAFLGSEVDCPALGPIPANRCLSEQRRPLTASNPQRVRIWRACRAGCIHSRIREHEPC